MSAPLLVASDVQADMRHEWGAGRGIKPAADSSWCTNSGQVLGLPMTTFGPGGASAECSHLKVVIVDNVLQATAARQLLEHNEHVAALQQHHQDALHQLHLQHVEEVQGLVQEQVGASMPTKLRRLGTAGHI